MGNDGQWKVYSESNIEVELNINDENSFLTPPISEYPNDGTYQRQQPKTIKGFTLRDDTGYVYEFGGMTSAIEYSENLLDGSDGETYFPWTANSWYLTSVKDKYGNELFSLQYEHRWYVAQFMNIKSSIVLSDKSYMAFFWKIGGHFGSSYSSSNLLFPYMGILSLPVYLTRINTSSGITVMFNYTNDTKTWHDYYPHLNDGTFYDNIRSMTGATFSNSLPLYYLQTSKPEPAQFQYPVTDYEKMNDPLLATRLSFLSNITIKKDQSFGKVYQLNYNHTPRTHLASVSFRGFSTDEITGTYSMDYDNFENLPTDYLTESVDHWGFYNGTVNTTPWYNITAADYYAAHNPSATALRYGMLKQLTYPTGGCSVFSYEPHDFSSVSSLNRQTMRDSTGIAGGVRIASILEYGDSTRANLLRRVSYRYCKPGSNVSSGELFAAPKYLWDNWQVSGVGSSSNVWLTLFCSASFAPLANSFGPHVGYSYVEEIDSDNSKTVYQFMNISQKNDLVFDYTFHTDDHSHKSSPYDMFSERGYVRGKLKRKTVFDANGIKRKSTGYAYRTDNVENKSVYSTNVKMVYGSAGDFAYYPGGIYRLFYPKYDIVSVMDTLYTSDGNIIFEKTDYEKQDITLNMTHGYSHQSDVRRILEEKRLRKSTYVKTAYEYGDQSSNGMAQDVVRHYFDMTPIRKTEYNGSVMAKESGSEFKEVTINGTSHIVPALYYERIGTGNRDTLVTYCNYTPTGRLSMFYGNDNLYTRLVWAYHDEYLMAKIKNGAYLTPDAIPDNYAFNQNWLSGYFADLRQRMSSSYITTYTWQPMAGVTSITLPNGNTTYYEYDTKWLGLSKILDKDHHELQRITYNYKR